MEVRTRIKANTELKSLPDIMPTAKASAYCHVTKPFEKDQLLVIVGTALGFYRRLDSMNDIRQIEKRILRNRDISHWITSGEGTGGYGNPVY